DQDGVVDRRRVDMAQTCPAGEPRKAVPDCLVVCGVKERRPGAVDPDVSGLEHRLQPRGCKSGRNIAAQVCPAFAGDLGRRWGSVERPADGSDVERDRREQLADEPCIYCERRTQVPFATLAKVWICRNAIGRVLEGDQRGDGGNGFFLHGVDLSLLLLRTAEAPEGHRRPETEFREDYVNPHGGYACCEYSRSSAMH